jgi:tRNA threonylcarbamoyladenosine biosynthesis protein TsaB
LPIVFFHSASYRYFAVVSLILNIETAVTGASICLSKSEQPTGYKGTTAQKETASWLQPAIQELCRECGISLKDLSAIAVSAGPGSYTGLRVGMASAKGLCYALGIPLITINTLQLMAAAALPASMLLCPMIDARRMEVFTAIYDTSLKEVQPTAPLVLDQNSFSEVLGKEPVLFFGNGSDKFQSLTQHPNALFKGIAFNATNMASLAVAAFERKQFADLAYSEPFYGKAFYSPGFSPSV